MKKTLQILAMLAMSLVLAGCSSSKNLYRKGMEQLKEENYGSAATFFQKAIDENPNRAEYYLSYGLAMISLGDYENALSAFDRVYMNKNVLVVRRNNVKVLRGKGIAYYQMQDYEKALECFDSAILLGENSELYEDLLYYKGNTLLLLGRYEGSVEIFSNIIEEEKKESLAYVLRAVAYQSMGDFDKSLADYEKALSIDPKNYEYYEGKYQLYMAMGDDKKAVEVLQNASKLKTKNQEDQYQLALLSYHLGEFDQALERLEQSAEDGYVEAQYYMGEIYSKKDYQQAIYHYELFIEEMARKESYKKPSSYARISVYQKIAQCYIGQKEYDKALPYVEKGIELGNTFLSADYWKMDIMIHEHLGKFDETLYKAQEYVKLYPTDEEVQKEIEFLLTRQMIVEE